MKPRRGHLEPGSTSGSVAAPSARSTDAARVTFLVRPRGEAWEISVAMDGACFIYDTRLEAVLRARGAAKRLWEDRHELSRVRTQNLQGRVRTVIKYGP